MIVPACRVALRLHPDKTCAVASHCHIACMPDVAHMEPKFCQGHLSSALSGMQAEEPLPEGVATRTVRERVLAADVQWLADLVDEAAPGVDTVTLCPGKRSDALVRDLHALLLATGWVCNVDPSSVLHPSLLDCSLLHFEYIGCTSELHTLLQFCMIIWQRWLHTAHAPHSNEDRKLTI